MRLKIEDVVAPLEEFAPLAYQEEFDNSGLLVGHPDNEVTGALLCVDVTEDVLREAARLEARLVISHHPVIFHPLRRLNGRGHVEKVVEHALREGIALYACHTNLDSTPGGMSWRLADMLGVGNLRTLDPHDRIATIRPKQEPGQGSGQGWKQEPGQGREHEPGQENARPGFGVIGTLPGQVDPLDFLRHVQDKLRIEAIRHSDIPPGKIDRVALCTGSAASLIPTARDAGAELFMAADFKYNDFAAASGELIVADIGHFESEFCAIELMYDVISKKIANFALHKSEGSRNPVSYLV